MKALSVRPKMGYFIAAGIKQEVQRSWMTDYIGDILIYTSNSIKDKSYVCGHAICVVELYDITKQAPNVYIWHIRNVRFIEPFPVKFRRHLCDVEDDRIINMKMPKGYRKPGGFGITVKQPDGRRKQIFNSFTYALNHWIDIGLFYFPKVKIVDPPTGLF